MTSDDVYVAHTLACRSLHINDTASNSFRYLHPFTEQDFDNLDWNEEDEGDRDTPRTLIELRMCELSAIIREKPDWHVKCRHDEIQAKWRKEIEEQQADLPEHLKLTSNMVRLQRTKNSCALINSSDQLCHD